VPGSGEIRLSDLQVDDPAALRFQRAGSHQDVESGFRPDPVHSLGEFHKVSQGPASGHI
jgi:hypothetical protein